MKLLTPAKLRELRMRPAAPPAPRPANIPVGAEAACLACQDRPGCPIWRLTPCAQAKAFKGDPAYPCPKGRWKITVPDSSEHGNGGTAR